MISAQVKAPKPFHPVILGADIGTYNLARSMQETYGVKPTVLAKMALGPVNHSKILDLILVDPEKSLVDSALDYADMIKEKHPDEDLVLLANSDTCVFEITEMEKALSKHYRFVFPSYQQVRETNGKYDFYRLGRKYGLAVPPTFEINLEDGVGAAEAALDAVWKEAKEQGLKPEDPSSPLESYRFPLIIKANTSYGYEYVRWPGKKKVYTAADRAEYRQILEELYPIACEHEGIGSFVVQPRILGNDTHNLNITAYVGQGNRVTQVATAQVLLEDHSPTALGNPGVMLVQRIPVLEKQVIRFLEGYGWRGFANFDGKVDPNTGIAYIFEVNPRIGRNNYYQNMVGLQPMRHLIDDLYDCHYQSVETSDQRALYYVLPLALTKRYVDAGLKRKIRFLCRHNQAGHPLLNPAERGFSLRFLLRTGYVWLNQLNHWRKFRRNYPVSVFKEDGVASFDAGVLTRSLD